MKYRFAAAKRYWKNFHALSPRQKASAGEAWLIFKHDPFDPRLGAHKIHHLSALAGETIYAVRVEGNLRVIFKIQGDTVYTLDIGTHDIYKP